MDIVLGFPHGLIGVFWVDLQQLKVENRHWGSLGHFAELVWARLVVHLELPRKTRYYCSAQLRGVDLGGASPSTEQLSMLMVSRTRLLEGVGKTSGVRQPSCQLHDWVRLPLGPLAGHAKLAHRSGDGVKMWVPRAESYHLWQFPACS